MKWFICLKLLVLTATGEQAYFGYIDCKVLQSVFLGPDTDASEDSGSICDLVLKHSLHNSFCKEDSIVKTFAESPVGDDLTRKLKNICTNAPPAWECNVDAFLPDKKYLTSHWYQFKILCGRWWKLIARNVVMFTHIGIAILFFGIIIGSLFKALDNSIMGSLGRMGYMFLNSFLVLMLSAAVTIPSSFLERVTLFKQRSAKFYSGQVAYLSQVLIDLCSWSSFAFMYFILLGRHESGSQSLFLLYGDTFRTRMCGASFWMLVVCLALKASFSQHNVIGAHSLVWHSGRFHASIHKHYMDFEVVILDHSSFLCV